MTTRWIGAALAALGWTIAPAAALASNCETIGSWWPCTTANGCAGSQECVGNYVSGCIPDDPVACSAWPGANDTFTATNAPNAPVGFLVDGKRGGFEIDDLTFVLTPSGAQATQTLGQMESSSLGNEVLSFAAGRAPTQHATAWTGGLDAFTSPMENTVRVPITIWILTPPGTYAAQSVEALSTVIDAGALFDAERLGLDFSMVELRDETNHANRSNFLDVTGLAALERDIGHVNGRFNVYWVESVNGGSGNGLGEVWHGDTVAVGMNCESGLLAHELGHNLALDHIDGDMRFDGTNVMQSWGGSRLYLTEGQGYRAHLRSISAIRSQWIYKLRPTMPIIDTCGLNQTTRNCPKADKRIWADGARWPAN